MVNVVELIPGPITPETEEHIRIALQYVVTQSEWIEIDGVLIKRLPREEKDA
jgi:hypothetical protein